MRERVIRKYNVNIRDIETMRYRLLVDTVSKMHSINEAIKKFDKAGKKKETYKTLLNNLKFGLLPGTLIESEPQKTITKTGKFNKDMESLNEMFKNITLTII